MPVTIPSTALGHLTEEERARLLEATFAAPVEDEATYVLLVTARLREFERRYEMDSDALIDALQRGALRETREVSQWLFWVAVWNHLGQSARPASP